MSLHLIKEIHFSFLKYRQPPTFMHNTFLEMCMKAKNRSKCYKVVPIPNSQKYYKTPNYGTNDQVLYARCYTVFNILRKIFNMKYRQ
jgi:hypothetical protein